MATKIKLMRIGKIRDPHYRIVVADARTKRDGRSIEEVGEYHPKDEPSTIKVDSERVQYWLGVGAQPTEPVAAILRVTGDWQKFKGEPAPEPLKVAAPRPDRRAAFEEAARESMKRGGSGGGGEATTPRKRAPRRPPPRLADAEPEAKAEKRSRPRRPRPRPIRARLPARLRPARLRRRPTSPRLRRPRPRRPRGSPVEAPARHRGLSARGRPRHLVRGIVDTRTTYGSTWSTPAVASGWRSGSTRMTWAR